MWFISFFTSRLGRVLAAVGAALAFVVGVWASGRKTGRQAAENDTLRDSHKRQEDGRNAVSDLRGADRDELVDQLRRNSDGW